MLTDFAILGIALFFGLLSGKLFDRMGVPEVIGIVLIGILMGESILGYITVDKLVYYKPLVDLTLAFFGFFIGAELKFPELRRLGLVILSILVLEVIVTHATVFSIVYLFTGNLFIALLLAAFSVSTAPAATADVIWEYKAEGDLTTTILALIGLDDAAAVLVFSVTSSYIYSILGDLRGPESPLNYFMNNIGMALIIGGLCGLMTILLAKYLKKRRDIFVMTIGIVVLASGIAEIFEASEILTTIIIGILFSNYHHESDSAIDALRELAAPIFTIFFVLVGAKLDIMTLSLVGVVGLVYVLSSMLGKTVGATLGAYLSKASDSIKNNIGFSLYSQAGIALGLASKVYYDLSQLGDIGISLANSILSIMVSGAIILLLIGPITLKYALKRAGEIGKIRKEEIIFEE
jgi:Kef-type K+ transport system membrane component KefB